MTHIYVMNGQIIQIGLKDVIPQSISTITAPELPNPAYHQFTGNIGIETTNEMVHLLLKIILLI